MRRRSLDLLIAVFDASFQVISFFLCLRLFPLINCKFD